MTCRHSSGDSNCSKNGGGYGAVLPPTPATPNAKEYELEEVERVGAHLVLKVKYPNCRSCAYEGSKVMVFLNVAEVAALRWRKIDPHFRDPRIKDGLTSAPSPAARFPASPEGWQDALTYTKGKR